MDRAFIIKGVNPAGRVIEQRLTAPSEADAKRMAEDAGLKFVVVTKPPQGKVNGEPKPPGLLA